ncbi:hypothetical protein [Streptomyces anulatus]|uniref:hypothetical protein n=1 Tax=Streptomyces anulatus TaxID=1892 RepID=UPI00324E9321
MPDERAIARAIAGHAEHLAHIPPGLKARAVSAVGPALQAQGEWLSLSTRQAVAAAVLVAVKDELEALAGLPNVAGSCPACGAVSLSLGEGGHVTCSRIDCPGPCAADELLHGGEAALVQALGGGRTAHVIAHNLNVHGYSLSDVRRMTDEEFRAVPGVGDTSLATIRRAFPAHPADGPQQPPSRTGDVFAALGRRIGKTLAKGISRDDYALAPASEPPVVATARIQLDAAPTSETVPVPLEAFDRLVRVAMWVSRGQSMAHVPDPATLIGARYPDAAARAALGALDDVGLLDPYPPDRRRGDAPDA